MPELTAHGLSVQTGAGWEGRVFKRPAHGETAAQDVVGAAAPPGEKTFAVAHVATIPLPIDAADYGSDVVEDLGRDDVFIVLKEFEPASATTALFASPGMPRRLQPNAFDPAILQRSLPGLAGHQAFFNEAGRAFTLYVVLGEFTRRSWTVPRINEVLATVRIDPLVAPPGEEVP